jgi:hypothetical protein
LLAANIAQEKAYCSTFVEDHILTQKMIPVTEAKLRLLGQLKKLNPQKE